MVVGGYVVRTGESPVIKVITQTHKWFLNASNFVDFVLWIISAECNVGKLKGTKVCSFLFLFLWSLGFCCFSSGNLQSPAFCLYLVAYIGCFMRQSGWSENHHHTGCKFKNLEARVDIVGGSHDLWETKWIDQCLLLETKDSARIWCDLSVCTSFLGISCSTYKQVQFLVFCLSFLLGF